MFVCLYISTDFFVIKRNIKQQRTSIYFILFLLHFAWSQYVSTQFNYNQTKKRKKQSATGPVLLSADGGCANDEWSNRLGAGRRGPDFYKKDGNCTDSQTDTAT